MTDSSSTPLDDDKVTPSATTPAPAPEAEKKDVPQAAPEEAKADAEPPAKEEPAAGKEGEPAGDEAPAKVEDAPAPAGEKKPGRARRWLSICFDAFLVLLLLAVLALAGYYFRLTAERYHVPTPMEQLLSESEELDRRYNELLPLANHADTQLHMRARLAQLEGQLARLSSLRAEKKASIDDQHGQVLAIQYAIRQADATNRGIARSLLPGMAVGSVTTTTGRAYRNATIYRLDKRFICLRFPEGQARFPVKYLVKDNLPELARYAFGELDLVDMSDFEQTGDPTAPVPTQATPAPKPLPEPAPHQQAKGYDPAPGAPVLDTEANRTTTSRVPEGEEAHEETWDAPSGELPM